MQDHSVLMLSPGQHAPGHYSYTISISQKPVEFGRLQGLCHHNCYQLQMPSQAGLWKCKKGSEFTDIHLTPPLPRVKAFKWKLLEISNV